MLMIADASDEVTARQIAESSKLKDQLILAARRWPDLEISDDDRSISFSKLLQESLEASDHSREYPPGSSIPVVEPTNTVEGLKHLLSAVFGLKTPLLIVPGAAQPELDRQSFEGPQGDEWLRSQALFLTTGGTTGLPKLIPRSHSSILQSIWLSASNAQLSENDSYLCTLSIAHNFSLACPGILGSLLFGAAVRMTERRGFRDVSEIVKEEEITSFPIIPATVRQWSGRTKISSNSMRLIQVGGSPVSAQDVAVLKRLFSCEVQISFGMSEGFLAQSSPDDSDEDRSNGITTMLSADDEYRLASLRKDAVGELEVRGPYTIRTYLAGSQVNSAKFSQDNWFRTGDLAVAIDDRRFRPIARGDESINRAGELVDPLSVESLVLSHPSVRGVVVFGVPHPTYESIIRAVVETDGSITGDDVLKWARSHYVNELSVPDSVITTPTIPRTSLGKPDVNATRVALGLAPVAEPSTREGQSRNESN